MKKIETSEYSSSLYNNTLDAETREFNQRIEEIL
jgi:hypothetical protein